MTENLFGTEMPLAIQFCLAFLVMLGLIGTIAWAVSRFGTGLSGGVSSRGRHSRISIIESTSVDRDRRLVLVRRDNIEVLLLIGGPIDVVIETNVIGAVAEPHDVPITRPSAPLLPPPRAIPLLDNGSMQRQPEPATIPRPAPRIEPPPTSAVSPHPSQAETSTRLQPDSLAALADNLSNRPLQLRKTPAAVTRPHPIEPRPELRPEPRVEPQPEPGIATPQPTGRPATVETFAPTPQMEELAADLAASARSGIGQAKCNGRASIRLAWRPRVAPAPEQASRRQRRCQCTLVTNARSALTDRCAPIHHSCTCGTRARRAPEQIGGGDNP